jgi:hypothetical protein
MQVIKQWIDESDVYLLILGGRYGSLERQSQKSYIHLEYEYALEKQKPLFAVVIDENYLDAKVKKLGRHVIETEYAPKLREFREFVCTRMVRFWSDPRDIKLAILETLAEFSRRDDIIGWIPGNEAVNTAVVAKQIAQLTKENSMLREQLEKYAKESTVKDHILYSGVTFYEMCDILKREKINGDTIDEYSMSVLGAIAHIFGDEEPSIFHLLFAFKDSITELEINSYDAPYLEYTRKLMGYGLLNTIDGILALTDEGRKFCMRLMTEDKAKIAEKYKI